MDLQAYTALMEERMEKSKFPSWEDLCVFLDVWCEEKKVKFTIRQSEALTEEDIRQYPGGAERAWALKYNSVHLGCSSCTSKNCPAFVQLKLSPEEDKLIVAGTSLHHNHDLPDMDVPLQNKRCRVTYPARLPAQMANDISWKFLDPSDLKKLLGLRSAVFEERTQILEELDSLFDADPDVKVKLVFLEGKLLIKSIFLMTSNMQDVAQKFPEHLYVDFIPSFSPGFDFYMVFCEEVGLAWKVCAYCFVKKDAADTLRFIMVSILQSIPTLKIQVKQILVNPEILDTLDLQALIPYTSVRYCLPLVLEVLYRKLSHLAPTAEVQVKNILHNLAHTLSPKVYDWYLNELKAACPPEVFQYYHETWHPRRKLWLNKENSTRAAENTIGVSTRATHQALLDRVGSSPSLHHCLQVVLSDSKPVLTVTTSSQEFTSRPQVIPSVVLETDATVASPEEEEKDEKSLSQLPGDSQSSENPVSEEDREEQLKRSEFYSWADFRSFLDSWCLKKNVLFVIRQSVPLKVNPLKLDLHWRELTESLKYSSVSMGCSVSKSCPASISLKLGPLKDKLVLVKAMLRHNHDTGANIPPPVSRSRLAPPPCLPTRITNDISRKFLERSDLSKLQKFHPAPSEDWTQILNELDILLISDPGAKVKLVFVENRLLVKSIFIMTSPMQDMIQCFPGYLYVDLLSRFGNLIDLYTVYCEDDSSEWKVCAKCIARKRSANLRFLMVSMLQSIQTLTNQVKYITLNPEIQNPLELEPLIPFASLRYCMPLVLEILYEKISHLGSTAEAQIKNFLHILAHTCSPSVYGRYLSELKAACPAEFFQYYYETWHPHRKMWIKKDNRSQIAESNICTLVKFEHQALRAIVYASSSLYHCLHVILHDNMTLLNATSSSHRQDLPSVLDASPADAAQQACESTKEEQLDQTEFSSWEDFCSFLDSWCEERKLMFTVRQSVTLTKEEISQCPSGPVLAQCLKYSTVQLFCTRNSCPALINLKLCPHKEKLIVSNTNFQHNHDLPETDLSPPLKRSKLASTIGLPVQIANNISRKFLEPNDLNTLQRFRSGAFEDRSQVLKELISLLLSDPEAKVKLVFEENKLQVKDIFLMTSSMQQIARCFPGYLYVDFFSGFSPGFDLYTVLCEEENVGWKACAYCIARKGTEDNLKFIVDSVFQSIPVLNSQVKCVTVSPEIQDTLDIEDLVPCASLRYCMPLVLELLYDKISQMNSAEEAQIKDFLHILAHTHSPTVYNQALNELKAACPAEAFQYYYETWHPRWKLWAEEYNSAPDAESSICAYVKSKHQLLAAQMGISPSLHRCLQVVLDDSKTTLHITDSSQDCPSGPAASPAVIQQADAAPMEEWMKQSRFQSWEDLCTFLDTWCEEKKVKFATCQSEALTEEDIRQYPGGAERAWALKYSRVRLGCSSCTSESCPAFIQLKLCPEEDKLIVASTSLLHNHDLPGMDAPPQIKRFRGKHPSRLPANIANDISCKFLEPNDLKELLSLRSTVFEERTCVLKELDTLFVSDPDAKVKLVFYEDKLLIKSIFLMTSSMQDVAQKFPEHLYVDFVSCFIPDYDFYTVFCEAKGEGWKVCAYCFARKGTPDTLRFIMVSMLQSIPIVKVQAKQITVNPEIPDTLDLEALIPHASMRYCMLLVLEILYRKVSQLDITAEAQVKNVLHVLTHTRSPKVYSRYLNELKAACPAEVFKYYYETWHPRRKLWMKKGTGTQAAKTSIGVSVHAKHQALLDQVGSSTSLHHCLQVVLTDSKPELTITEASQEFSSGPHMTPSVMQEACESTKEEPLDQTEFSSWVDFCLYLDSWCEDRKLLFTVRQSVALTKDEVSRCPSGPVLAQCLKYSTVQLFCTRKSCPAFIKLQLCPQKEKLVVSNTNFQHNHDLPETDLSPPLKRSKLASTVGLPVQIANNISRKFLEPHDLNALQRFRSGAFEDRSQVLKELDSLFFSDPEAKVKLVFEENKLLVKDIFLMTSSMQQIARCFPGYLYVDFFSGFSPGFDLYTVLCEEENVGWKACAYCIARKGTADNLKFIVDSVFQSIPVLNSQVKCVTVSPEIQDTLDIEDLVPCASLRYCMPLVLELLYDKISHMNSAEEAQIKDFLHVLAHTHSPTVYNQALNELKAACPAETFQYYYETWHPRWKLWAEEYNSASDAESSICAYVKSKHQILAAQMGISPSLHRCLQVVLDDSKTTLPITDSSQECFSGPAVNSEGMQQKAEVLTSSLDKEETEESSAERCEDLGISKRQVGEAPVEEQLERNEFHSWEDFCSFLDDWCEERKLMFAIRHSVTLTEEDVSQDPRGPEAAKSLRYSTVRLGCSVFTRRKDCPAFIKLRLSPQKDKLIVTKAILHHNHDLPETALPPEMKRCRLMAPTDLPTRIANDISRKFLECNDLKRLQRFHSDAFEDRTQVLTELGSLFISDPGVKVKLVFVEDKGLVKNIFLMTSHMQDLAHRFAGHLYVDLLAGFSPGFALYTVFCEEEGMGWKVCAYCLARKGTSDTLRFLMVSVLQSILKLNISVKHLTVSPEIDDPLDLEALVPYASVRYCMPLVLKLLYSKISYLDAIVQTQIKNLLHDLAHSLSPEIYSHSLTDLIAVCPADFFQYYYDNWHPCRKLWVKGQSKNQAAENSICVCVKARHLALVDQMGASSSLHHCLEVILSDSRLALEAKKTFDAREAGAVTGTDPTGSHQHMEAVLEAAAPECPAFPAATPLLMIKQEAASVPISVTSAAESASMAIVDAHISKDLKSEILDSCTEGSLLSTALGLPSISSWQSTECTKDQLGDKPADLKGREFFSWMAFRHFFDLWCQENKVLYKMKSCTPLDKVKISRSPSAELVATLKYGFVRLVCKHAFAMQTSLRKSPWETPPCPANIILRAGPCGDRLLITEAELEHNHQLSDKEFTSCFPKFRLKSKQHLLAEMTNSVSKQFLMAQDLQKLVERSSGEEPVLQDLLKELTALFAMDSRAKVKLIFCPDSVAVDGVFLMTSRMRCLFQRFPAVLYLHRSMSVNEDFKLYTVLCEGEDSRAQECAYFIARIDSQTPVRFMVVSLMQCVPDTVKPQIQSILLDTDFKELNLIRTLLPKRIVVMSQIYALETLYSRVAQEDPSVQETMRNIIHNLAYARAPDVYQRNLRELEAVSLVDFLQYFLENWHYRKELWVACWGLPQPERSRFSNHMRSHQEKLAPVLSPSTTLAACVGGLVRLQTLKMLTATLEEEKISSLYQSVCSSASLKLVQEEISLTKQGSYEIREQERGFVLNDSISDFFINRTISKCSCSIYTSSLLPCRHLFATRLWAGEAIFDLKLMQGQ
ncbi:uncharacterized protein LOC115080765 isoform X3 [Rhinatrema bivittatum]|uniref:uncharacterized protein LOC115080765 isoform X3 n=1 Tax=Rhinatrema bivittatum TaxID=194408 RepID=UPI001127E816|nr:uncharacterized protein LOC115080765 isoform X3 [Rhinatrema bivittatum]